MVSLLFGSIADAEAPAHENVVRRTTTPVEIDTPPAEARNAPEYNELETDPNAELGMSGRQVASDWIESEQYAPWWSGQVDEHYQHNNIVDVQVSTSGTAAARERSGMQGHGTFPTAIGIEPTIRDGASYGQDYFKSTDKPVQDTSTPEFGVQPPHDQNARDDIIAVSAYGVDAAMDAATAGMYDRWNR